MDPGADFGSSAQAESELESFREKWRAEVSARAKGRNIAPQASASSSGPARGLRKVGAPSSQPLQVRSYTESEYQPRSYHDLDDKQEHQKVGNERLKEPDPQSALEHYEKAAERETQGNLGDSVNLYRKAFKLDSGVHETYKNKHFPASKPPNPNPSNAAVTVPETGHHSLHGRANLTSVLIDDFANLSVSPAESRTCHIASIPEELLVEIMLSVAISDVAAFARLAQVCKRFAYLVITEERLWKRVTLGSEVGFGAMRYHYACDLKGQPLSTPFTLRDLTPVPFPTYRAQFRSRPRIRFNGCYISTVNYTRAGVSTQSTLSWNSPVHIVTYYRYLRFFRDGTAISLLTTAEPADVVHHLTMENAHSNHSGFLPSAVMKDALRGRWRLSGSCSSVPNDDVGESRGPGEYTREPINSDQVVSGPEEEGDVHVETEGVVPKYMWKMQFALGSAGRKDGGTRNNKLGWKGFWSYNRLTDDWGEFGLKNDRAFYWSRVKSYT